MVGGLLSAGGQSGETRHPARDEGMRLSRDQHSEEHAPGWRGGGHGAPRKLVGPGRATPRPRQPQTQQALLMVGDTREPLSSSEAPRPGGSPPNADTRAPSPPAASTPDPTEGRTPWRPSGYNPTVRAQGCVSMPTRRPP